MGQISSSYCVYPFINVHTNTDGRCKLCCHVYGEDYIQVDGKDAVLGKTKWSNIWNSDYMEDVRSKMLSGGRVKECDRCFEHEAKGLQSSRQWANENYTAPTLHSNPTHLELRLGNKCNLKCNSCWSVSSNQIYKERKKMLAKEKKIPEWLYYQWKHEIKSVEEHDWAWYETQDFRDFVDDVAPTLERLYLTGGEPTMIDANEYVLNKLVEVGNKDCYVAWTTNMTTWPEGFYDKLEFFDSSEVQMSIDGYGSHNMYIRYPTDWNKVEENFAKAMTLPSKVELKIYFVYQAWNVFDVDRLIRWLESRQTRRVDFVPIFLEHPDQLHSCVWPTEIKHKVIGKLFTLETTTHRDPVQRIINYTQNTHKYSEENINRMRQFISINDRYRKYKFADVFPTLNYILEEVCKT